DRSALPGALKPIYDICPAPVQEKGGFCKDLEARPDGATLLGHFNVVRGDAAKLEAVPYTVAYAAETGAISKALTEAADLMAKNPKETALVTYLRAAAAS